jgi:hypothetical protein
MYIFYLSKFYELIDTVLIVLRKVCVRPVMSVSSQAISSPTSFLYCPRIGFFVISNPSPDPSCFFDLKYRANSSSCMSTTTGSPCYSALCALIARILINGVPPASMPLSTSPWYVLFHFLVIYTNVAFFFILRY